MSDERPTGGPFDLLSSLVGRRDGSATRSIPVPGVQPTRWTLEVEVEPDTVDGGYVTSCPALPGAIAQGETQREAVEALMSVVFDMLDEDN